MSNPSFQFKQFTIWHDKCAMKVGTDGVLLGAWVQVDDSKRILDIGTGTGLISLQLAQRNINSKITAIEIDAVAAEQARKNVSHSPWPNRIKVICCDFCDYQTEDKFDLIVSNPPFFTDALKCPNEQRRLARHTGELNYELLFHHSANLLAAQGTISIIIPSDIEKNVIETAGKHKLFPSQRLRVYTKPEKPCRRVLLSFSLQETKCTEKELCIETEHHQYTPEYIALTKEFYLKM